MIGQTISHYRIVEKVGEGGMGVVYKAEDLKLKRTVALKFLHVRAITDRERRARFLHEAQAAAALDHPNICTVYEIDEVDDHLFIAMAFLEGVSLAHRVEAGPLPVKDSIDIAFQVALGLQAAHRKDIVHRDIKSSNVMVCDQGDGQRQVTLMDFGLARLSEATKLTVDGARVGTAAYMSPEQASGEQVDHRADIWATGVVMYEMLTGRLPFKGEYDQALMYSIVCEEPEPITGLRTGVPLELERIVFKCLEKRPADRFQSVTELLVDLRSLQRQFESSDSRTMIARRPTSREAGRPAPSGLSRPRFAIPVVAAGALLLTAATALITWRMARPTAAPSSAPVNYKLTQLTRDVGLTTTPALSPDGNLIAYSSDRGSPHNLDLWVQQVAGGGAVRLTSSEAADHSPSFSPDSSRIAFRSDRAGGGIYIMPALGGDARFIAREGQRPRFSPDGRQLAYYTGPPGSIVGAKLFVVSVDGGQPRQLQADFASATEPIWAPDGSHLLFMGRHSTGGDEIWMTPLDGGEPLSTGLRALCSQYGISFMHLDSWAEGGGYVVFSGVEGDAENLWRARISTASWTFSNRPERLTFGVAEKEATVAAGGRIAFVNGMRRVDIWSLPVHSEEGVAAGEMERLTQSGATDTSSDTSVDGRVITFRSNRSGTSDVWTKDVVTGKETALTSNADLESIPKISPDGARVAFSLSGAEPGTIRIAGAAGGLAERVCADCGPPSGWSPDGAKIYYLTGFNGRVTVHLLDIASGKHHLLVEHPEYSVYAPRMSFDGRWMTFKVDLPAGTTQVYAAPVEDQPPPVERWATITDGGYWDDIPRWSPGGGTIYFVSDRDGFRCIWARRADPASKQPRGDVFPVQHLHQLRLSMLRLSLNEFELAVARERLVFPMAELSGNIWLMEPVANR